MSAIRAPERTNFVVGFHAVPPEAIFGGKTADRRRRTTDKRTLETLQQIVSLQYQTSTRGSIGPSSPKLTHVISLVVATTKGAGNGLVTVTRQSVCLIVMSNGPKDRGRRQLGLKGGRQ